MSDLRTPGYDIRLATDDDLSDIGEMTVRSYVHDALLEHSDFYADRLRDAASRAADSELWVAVDRADGRVLGSVTFCPTGSSYRELARDSEGEFRMLAVDPSARGRGVGTALAEHCIERARDLGFDALVLCSSTPMTTAQWIYKSLGFVRDPSLDWSPVPGVDLMGFRLDLEEPPASDQDR